MAIIGQVRRMIRLEEERKRKKYEFEHRTQTQGVKDKPGKFGKVIKTITHFPPKKEEATS